MFLKVIVTGFIIGVIMAMLVGTDIWVGGTGCAMFAGAIYLKYA